MVQLFKDFSSLWSVLQTGSASSGRADREDSVRLEVPVLGPRTTKYSTITSRSLYYA